MEDEKFSQGDSDVSEAEDDDSNEDQTQNAPIMSLFASFYGIEDPSKNSYGASGRGTIDDANFDVDSYVKEMLLHQSMESLIVKDAEMVHEIRTLDGEMQKLVYDNYNKFITATETIKEMKKDVYGMDGDMESVRTNMTSIIQSSKELDNILEDKRVKVDKLVRVRRLLERLEFLSELPERLALMIQDKKYIEAVKLYNKTISVLTRHSHVLSFKKIKERTELMMADLTEKVVDMLDDSSLEAVKLTQFISILRLMNAPREKVLKKFLSAHTRRSAAMTATFRKSIEQGSFTVASARQYHQSILVGLIEACKGITELYQGVASTETEATLSHIETEFFHCIHLTVQEHTRVLAKGFNRFFQEFYEYFQKIHLELSPLTPEEVESLQDFQMDLRTSSQTKEEIEAEQTEEGITVSANRFTFQEDRSAWLQLARQSILDVQYLDKTFSDTCALFHGIGKKRPNTTTTTSSVSTDVSFAASFSDSLLQEVDSHTTNMRKHFLKSYVKEMMLWFPRFLQVLERQSITANASSTTTTGDETTPNITANSTTGSPDSRSLFQRKWQVIQTLLKLMGTHATEAFSECARYVKHLIDIYEVAAMDPSVLCKKLIVEFSTFLVQEIESHCGLDRNRTILRDTRPPQEEDGHEIYTVATVEFQKTCGLQLDSASSHSAIKGNILLYFAAILRSLLQSIPMIMQEELSSHEFPPLDDTSMEQNLSQRKLEETIRDLVSYFVELNSGYSADTFAASALRHYLQSASRVSQGNTVTSLDSVTVSRPVLDFLQYLDQLATNCYVLFQESPPQARIVVDRRGPGRQSIAVTNSNLALQMDIERLFSQRVTVFPTIVSNASSEVIVGTVIKSAIKAVQEEMRNVTLVYEAYVQIRAEVTFVKAQSSFILRETSELDSLVDLALSTVFSRYLGANDISNVTDNSEAMIVSRSHAEALQSLSDHLNLIGKTK